MNIIHLFIYLILTIKLSNEITFQLHQINAKNHLSLRNLHTLSTVYGNSHNLNYYYAFLYLGKEGKKQSYILDTGSSVTTSPCSLCTNCGRHQNGLYEVIQDNILKCDMEKCNYVSNTCGGMLNKDCEFSVSYSEGSSISGKYINQLIRFCDDYSNEDTFEFPIGCTNRETHLFRTQLADGIMGLQNTEKSFPSVLHRLGIIENNVFSLCFGQEGGFFAIGELIFDAHLSNNISYMNLQNDKFYLVDLYNVEINGKIVNINERGRINYNAIIDSGTTISYFPSSIANEMVNIIKEICNKEENKNKCGNNTRDRELGDCYSFNNKTNMFYAIDNIFPNITFVFQDNNSFVWEPRNYYFDNSGYYPGFCLGFVGENTRRFTFGGTFMRGYDFIFNKKDSKIGFVQANCNYDYKKKKDSNNSNKDIIGTEQNDKNTNVISENSNKYDFIDIILTALLVVSIVILIIFSVFMLVKKIRKNFQNKDYSKAEIELSEEKSKNALEIMPNNEPAIKKVEIPNQEKIAKVVQEKEIINNKT